MPAGDIEEAQRAVDAAARFARLAGVQEAEIVLVHVADGRPAPQVAAPAGFSLVVHESSGSVEHAVAALAQQLDVCLLVMTTRGHDGLSDVILGSHTERVLHRLARPLLWLPSSPTFPRE